MAFWGVEVKPGKPHIHPTNGAKGRLHISQATLGTGSGTGRIVLQCNIGNKSPVFLCSLFPERSESCQLNIEFNEVEQVVFSVIGPRSVHITGYYLQSTPIDDESESFGEDIAATESDRSLEEDDYDYSDDFINDGEIYVVPNTSSDEERPKKVKRKFRRLRKHQSSDEDTPLANKVPDSNKEILSSDSDAFVDDFFISMKKQKGLKVVENGDRPQEVSADAEKKVEDAGNAEKKALAADNQSSAVNESASPQNISKKKKKKKKQSEEVNASDKKNRKKKNIGETTESEVGVESSDKKSRKKKKKKRISKNAEA